MIVIVMGVTGSGKTTVGELLARRFGWQFLDADDFHSAANKAKMHAGTPLTDADRIPWLSAIHAKLVEIDTAKGNAVLGCSALKRSYRDLLMAGIESQLVYLKGSYDFIAERLQARKGHFADKHILAGQFRDLEEPTVEKAIVVDIAPPAEKIVEEIARQLNVAKNE
jgi:gluconokinase